MQGIPQLPQGYDPDDHKKVAVNGKVPEPIKLILDKIRDDLGYSSHGVTLEAILTPFFQGHIPVKIVSNADGSAEEMELLKAQLRKAQNRASNYQLEIDNLTQQVTILENAVKQPVREYQTTPVTERLEQVSDNGLSAFNQSLTNETEQNQHEKNEFVTNSETDPLTERLEKPVTASNQYFEKSLTHGEQPVYDKEANNPSNRHISLENEPIKSAEYWKERVIELEQQVTDILDQQYTEEGGLLDRTVQELGELKKHTFKQDRTLADCQQSGKKLYGQYQELSHSHTVEKWAMERTLIYLRDNLQKFYQIPINLEEIKALHTHFKTQYPNETSSH